ncbi:MAG: murein biosynthesis integral membrane protein MurJ [Defluviitaleaceae bacterium]|nr:murein biosynthesis integral membrane protein MurJ [Defluviitaleaceae bacterium]
MKEKPLVTTVGLMMIIALAGKVMGLMRDRLIGVHYGTYSIEGIAFTQASLLPRLFLDIMFASVFSASFIPVFSGLLTTKGKKAAFDLAARFIAIIGFLTMVVTILGILFAAPLYTVFFEGDYASAEIREMGIHLLRRMFPLMILSGLAFSLAGVLQSMGEFNIPSAMSVASNGVILLYFFFLIDRFGVEGLAVAFLIGWLMQIVIQVPFLIRNGFRLNLKNLAVWRTFKDPEIRKIARLTLPVMVATWLAPVNLLVNGRAAMDLYGGEHGYMAINFANTLYTIVTGLFVLSLANVLLPKLSALAAKGDLVAFVEFLRSSLRGMVFILLPMAFGIMAISRPLVRLVFEGGRFDATSVEITAQALFFLAMGILGFGMQIILSRACYALQNGRAPLVTAVFAMVLNLILSFTLAPVLEIGGVALASAISISAAGLGLFILLRRRLAGHSIWTWPMTADALKMLIMAVAVFFAARYTLDLVEGTLKRYDEVTLLVRIASVAVPAAAGVAVYMVGCLFLRVKEARLALEYMWGRLYVGKKGN